jgi:ATP-dependent Clp protease ATP-binding subunit ClpA
MEATAPPEPGPPQEPEAPRIDRPIVRQGRLASLWLQLRRMAGAPPGIEPFAGQERFTRQARQIVQLAAAHAQQTNHEYVGTEHILLGLLDLGEGMALRILDGQGIDPDQVRDELLKLVQPGPPLRLPASVPLTPRAHNVLRFAREEADALGLRDVATEQVLIGLLREAEGLAAGVLLSLGLDLGEVRRSVRMRLGRGTR